MFFWKKREILEEYLGSIFDFSLARQSDCQDVLSRDGTESAYALSIHHSTIELPKTVVFRFYSKSFCLEVGEDPDVRMAQELNKVVLFSNTRIRSYLADMLLSLPDEEYALVGYPLEPLNEKCKTIEISHLAWLERNGFYMTLTLSRDLYDSSILVDIAIQIIPASEYAEFSKSRIGKPLERTFMVLPEFRMVNNEL